MRADLAERDSRKYKDKLELTLAALMFTLYYIPYATV